MIYFVFKGPDVSPVFFGPFDDKYAADSEERMVKMRKYYPYCDVFKMTFGKMGAAPICEPITGALLDAKPNTKTDEAVHSRNEDDISAFLPSPRKLPSSSQEPPKALSQ